ncbi:hypothetical protein A4X13_0g3081 [Tilletia indica]|uniref:Uncharacterized protein n=1 Tax=Tilletia indica TaxID=43049 RepID=A0A177TQ54_9BASI|nr:hypothetical protein A4X13_0g3081 [Tilletia indica]
MAKRKSTALVVAGPSSARKKPKTSKAPQQSKNANVLSAADRFVRVAELVEIVIAQLARDRIDLVSIASVCKHLRMPALGMWVKNLYLPLSAVHKRLSLFQAHPELLREVRSIRIHNDLVEFQCDMMKNFYPVERRLHWVELKDLFTLMAEQFGPTYSRVPAFDITVADTDAQAMVDSISVSTDFVGNVVALRIIPQVLSMSRTVQKRSRDQASPDEADSDGTYGYGYASDRKYPDIDSDSDTSPAQPAGPLLLLNGTAGPESEDEEQDSDMEDSDAASTSGSLDSNADPVLLAISRVAKQLSATTKLLVKKMNSLDRRMTAMEKWALEPDSSDLDSKDDPDGNVLDNPDLTDATTEQAADVDSDSDADDDDDSNDEVEADSSSDSDSDDNPNAGPTSDSASSAPDIAAERRAEAWSKDWDALSAFVINVRKESTRLSKSGLLVFHYGCKQSDYENSGGWDYEVPASFWVALKESGAATLLDLAISSAPNDHGYSHVFHHEFAALRNLNLTHAYIESEEMLAIFLNAHTSLEQLTLDVADGLEEPDTLLQTFPRLSWLHTSAYRPPRRQQALEFVRRHPELSNLADTRMFNSAAIAASAADTELFPNLRFLSTTSEKNLIPYLRRGGRLRHLCIMNEKHASDELRIHDLAKHFWLSRDTAAAEAITCLEISQHIHSSAFLPHLRSAFTSDFLPNLTELCISFEKKNKSFIGQDLDTEAEIGRIFEALVPARSLQVLRLCDQSVPFHSKEILVGNIFPPALELFGWLEPPLQRPQYFRFLPNSSSKPLSAKSAGKKKEGVGKRGRLQWIPSCFRAKVTIEGVWDQPFDGTRTGTILDHTGIKPTLVLS